MSPLAPPSLVVGAPRLPLPYGLFSTFTLRPAAGDRWEGGVQFETGTCEPVGGIGQPQCDPDPTVGLPKELDPNNGDVGLSTPFGVYGHFSCGPTGYPLAAAQDLATAHLLGREEARVEQAFWTGDLGNEPNLTTATIISGGAASESVASGLAYLEFVIGQHYGSVGVIHMTRGMALIAAGQQLLETAGGRLVTKLGTPVAAGAGYSGEGPEGSAATGAGQSYAFATPAVFGYRSDVFIPSSVPGDLLDRAQNNAFAVAERTYLLGFDPCGVGAVLLDLSK